MDQIYDGSDTFGDRLAESQILRASDRNEETITTDPFRPLCVCTHGPGSISQYCGEILRSAQNDGIGG